MSFGWNDCQWIDPEDTCEVEPEVEEGMVVIQTYADGTVFTDIIEPEENEQWREDLLVPAGDGEHFTAECWTCWCQFDGTYTTWGKEELVWKIEL